MASVRSRSTRLDTKMIANTDWPIQSSHSIFKPNTDHCLLNYIYDFFTLILGARCALQLYLDKQSMWLCMICVCCFLDCLHWIHNGFESIERDVDALNRLLLFWLVLFVLTFNGFVREMLRVYSSFYVIHVWIGGFKSLSLYGNIIVWRSRILIFVTSTFLRILLAFFFGDESFMFQWFYCFCSNLCWAFNSDRPKHFRRLCIRFTL